MPEPSIPGLTRVESVQPTPVVPPLPSGGSRPGRPMPGVDEFDRAELSGGGVPRAYAKFVVHQKTGQVSIKIVEAETDRVIREIPPETVLRLAEQLQSYMDAQHRRKG